jgi:hypothetical protein
VVAEATGGGFERCFVKLYKGEFTQPVQPSEHPTRALRGFMFFYLLRPLIRPFLLIGLKIVFFSLLVWLVRNKFVTLHPLNT